jgi:hypothetical protein
VMMGSNSTITFPVTNPTSPPPPPVHHTTSATYYGNGNPPLYLNNNFTDIIKTSITHHVVIPGNLIQEAELAEGCYIAACDSEGHCFGITVVQNGNTALAMFGDDPTTVVKDGFYEGEAIFFTCFAQGDLQETPLLVEFDRNLPQISGTFTENGLSALSNISIVKRISPFDENLVSIFPNPARQKLTIRADVPENTDFVISNLQAQTVFSGSLTGKITEVDVSSFTPGIFIIKILNENSLFFKQFVKQ